MPIREAGRVRARARAASAPHPVREARQKAGVTMTELAKKAQISFTTLWRIENRLVKPRTHTLKKLFDALSGQT